MNTKTETPPQPVQPPVTVPPPKNNTPMIVIIVCLTLLIGVMGGYIVFTKTSSAPVATLPTPEPTIQTLPTITSFPSASPSTPSVTSTMSVTPTVKPTIVPNPDGKTFSSDKLGVAFYYGSTMGYDKNTTIKILESGNKVYLYEASMKPETGQSIERFTKDAKDTLSQAITKQFLTGIPTSDCFVKVDPKKPKPTVTKATIGYPIPANADQPNFTYGEKCPEHYSESNGMAYFYEDSSYPDRFYFVSIGQYGIPAQNSKPDSMWQDTIIIF